MIKAPEKLVAKQKLVTKYQTQLASYRQPVEETLRKQLTLRKN
jgi:hypothetical protein